MLNTINSCKKNVISTKYTSSVACNSISRSKKKKKVQTLYSPQENKTDVFRPCTSKMPLPALQANILYSGVSLAGGGGSDAFILTVSTAAFCTRHIRLAVKGASAARLHYRERHTFKAG